MKYCRKCGSKMSEDAVFCSKCGCKFIEPEETDEIIKDTADKTEISSKTELYPEEYPTEEENTDMQLQNDLSARYSVEQNDINDNVPPLLTEQIQYHRQFLAYQSSFSEFPCLFLLHIYEQVTLCRILLRLLFLNTLWLLSTDPQE